MLPRGEEKFVFFIIIVSFPYGLESHPLEGLNRPSNWMANSRLKDCQWFIGAVHFALASRTAKYISFFASPTLVKCPRTRTTRRTVAFKLSIALVV